MKKIFIVTGELSGDRLAAWYLARLKKQESNLEVQAIGGNFLQAEGAVLYKRFESLNLTGIVEIIAHLPEVLRIMRELVDYIAQNGFDEVLVVDFPGFNLRLIRLLKSAIKNIKITYLSPPQLWCWGAWRVKKLKKYCDRVIVLYPFEVEWYRKHDVTVEWLGTPVYELLAPYRMQSKSKEALIALVPGSRKTEIERLLPLFLRVAQVLKRKNPELRFVLPRAQSVSTSELEVLIKKHDLGTIWDSVTLVEGEAEKFAVLARCCAALSKPGTVTLELALLGVPTVVAYKTSWLTYFIARMLVKVSSMTLPNLLTGQTIFKECIQYSCDPETIAAEIDKLYHAFCQQGDEYQLIVDKLHKVAEVVAQK